MFTRKLQDRCRNNRGLRPSYLRRLRLLSTAAGRSCIDVDVGKADAELCCRGFKAQPQLGFARLTDASFNASSTGNDLPFAVAARNADGARCYRGLVEHGADLATLDRGQQLRRDRLCRAVNDL